MVNFCTVLFFLGAVLADLAFLGAAAAAGAAAAVAGAGAAALAAGAAAALGAALAGAAVLALMERVGKGDGNREQHWAARSEAKTSRDPRSKQDTR